MSTGTDFTGRDFARAHTLLEAAGCALDKGDSKRLLDAARKLQALAERVAGKGEQS